MFRVAIVFYVVAVFVTDAAEIRTCVCNKDDTMQLPVLNSTNLNPFVIGYLNPRQCRTFVNTLATDSSWLIIEINNVQGYIAQSSDFILIAECPGSGGVFQTASPNSPINVPHGCVTPHITNSLKGDVSQCPAHVVQEANAKCLVLVQHGHTCYEFIINKATWMHAQAVCKRKGGYLVTIHSAAENQYIHHVVGQINQIGTIWIGLHDRNKEGHFEWANGEQLTYQHFSDHSIHDAHGPNNEQDCVKMMSAGQWEDAHCGDDSHHSPSSHSYVCEYAANKFGTNVVG